MAKKKVKTKKASTKVSSKEMPLGVKIISVLTYIGAVLGFLLGIMFLLGANLINDSKLAPAIITTIGVLFLVIGAFSFFIARGLWKGKNWARIVVIVFSALGAFSAILSLLAGDFRQLFNLAIDCLIGGYLWFNKDVKAAFE